MLTGILKGLGLLNGSLRRASPVTSKSVIPETGPKLSFSRSGWILARILRAAGGLLAFVIGRINRGSISLQAVIDRVVHLNEILGYFLPSLARVVSNATVDGTLYVFRPFTDDVDKLSLSYEPMLREFLSPKPSEVIVDIGANIGVHTMWLAKKVGPNGLIVAVEPEWSSFRILNLNRQLNSLNNIVAVRTALSSAAKTGTLVVPRPTLMGRATIQPSVVTSKSYSIKVNFETLDNVVSSRQIPTVSAIKIDVEGAEMLVLRGATKTIEKFRPRLILEVHGESNLDEVRKFLASMGMVIPLDSLATSRSDEGRHFILAVPRIEET